MDIFLATLFTVVCLLLIVVVLLQKGRGGGLGAAFGGMGASAFGTRTGDVFTWVTIVLTGLFLVLSVGVNFAYRPKADVVSAPWFDPPGGPIAAATAVKVACPTQHTEIHYTTDGSDPSKDAIKLAQDTVLVQPGTTLSAIAYRDGWTPSEIARSYYGPVEQAPPETQPGEAPPAETAPADEPGASEADRPSGGAEAPSSSGETGSPAESDSDPGGAPPPSSG